jgi:hypothetical protein
MRQLGEETFCEVPGRESCLLGVWERELFIRHLGEGSVY